MTVRKIDELYLEMKALDLKTDDLVLEQKGVKKIMVERLREFYLEESFAGNIPFTLSQVLRYESPMLCFRYKDLKESEQEDVLGGGDWIAEEKLNGIRCLVSYHKDEGFRFFSRHTSVQNYFPVDLTWAAPIVFGEAWAGGYYFGHQIRLKWEGESFVCDAELTLEERHLKVGKDVSTSALSGMVALGNARVEVAKEAIDREWEEKKEPLVKINLFDVLEINGESLVDLMWLKRKRKLMELFRETMKISPSFSVVKSHMKDRLSLYQDILAKPGGEGIVLKNIGSPYFADTGRKRAGWVKMKRSMTGAVLEDLDVWIGGWEEGTKGKRHEGKVGTLLLFTNLKRADGSIEEYHIASVGSMSDSLRNEMTISGTDENFELQPDLRESFYRRVLSIDGMSISPKNRRITHATVDWDNCWKDMKTPDMCELEEEVLEKNII